MMALTALHGKTGRLQSVISGPTSVNHEFEDWDLSLEAEMVEVNGFEKSADSDGNYWNSYLVGLNSGLANFAGRHNTSKNPTSSFKPGSAYTYTSLFCGISSSVGFTVTGKCKSIGSDQKFKGVGGFKGSFQVEGVTTYPS